MKAVQHTQFADLDEIRTHAPEVEEFIYVEHSAAEEIPAFIPTRYELKQIVKFWYRMRLEADWDFFLYEACHSIESSRDRLGGIRMQQIAELIGADDVGKVREETRAEFGKTQDPESWQIFCHGTEEQRKVVREKVRREWDEARRRHEKASLSS